MLENKGTAKATPKDKAGVARKPKAPATTRPGARTVPASSVASAACRDDLDERVRRRAYELWESEGRPAGREYDHWLQAEREVVATPRQHAA